MTECSCRWTSERAMLWLAEDTALSIPRKSCLPPVGRQGASTPGAVTGLGAMRVESTATVGLPDGAGMIPTGVLMSYPFLSVLEERSGAGSGISLVTIRESMGRGAA